MRFLSITIIICIELSGFAGGLSLAYAEPFVLTPALNGEALGRHIEVLIDKAGNLSLDEVRSLKNSDHFRSFDSDVPRFGRSNSPVWVRIPVVNPSTETLHWVLEYNQRFTEFVELYQPNSQGDYRVIATGSRRDFATRDIQHPSFVFALTAAPGQQTDYYLRIETIIPIFLDFTAWSPGAYQKNFGILYLIIGLGLGAVLVLVAYNFLLYLAIRDSAYLFYVLSTAPTLVNRFVFWGFGIQYFALGFDTSLKIISVGLALSLGFLTLFVRRFLELHHAAPRLDRLLEILQWMLFFVLIPLALFRESPLPMLDTALFALMSLIFAFVGVYLWWRGYRAARLFVLAFMFYFAGVATFALLMFSLIEATFWSRLGFMIGGTLEGIMLSFALADRINILREESATAQRKALQQEQLLSETLAQAKAELESQVALRTADLEQAKNAAEYLARTDSLTQLYNRRAFWEISQHEISRTLRNNRPLSVIMLDVDHFKEINDNHGHATGDTVLTEIAKILKNCLRNVDTSARLGGDEFVILLPETNTEDAVVVAEKIHLAISHCTTVGVQLSASIGVASLHERSDTLDRLLQRCDAALYDAKKTGRNRVSVAN